MSRITTGRATRLRRAGVLLPTLALTAAGLAATGASGGASVASEKPSPATIGAGEYYMNTVAPRLEPGNRDIVLGKDGKPTKAVRDALREAVAYDAKSAQGNPVAARQLARLEAKAIKTGKSPKELKRNYKGAKATQVAKLLTILVEFDENANDDFTGTMVPAYWLSLIHI